MLTSVDVGMVRDSVIKAEADVELARKESDWATEISQNLDDLIKLLGRTPEVTYVEKHFEDKLLGDHREKVLSAYSKYLFAKRSAADTTAMNESGAISSRLVQERNSAREQTVAGFEATCEQSKFDAQQHRLRMLAALQHTERLLAVERQKLQLLLGPFAEILPTADDKALCELVLRAPLSGVVEERLVADGLQFTNSQTLFTVANTETLWVSAQVYERDWAALADGQVREVTVEVPAVPAKPVTARVKFTGVTISPETRSIPLVAELPNAEGHFKPGMFAWVSIPLSEPHHALVVPTEAVMRDQQATYVFVEERPGRYRKVDVKIGLETPQRIEILSGLHGGETVVNHGAFFLKSELLLALQSDGE
jgi:cobalt-zinc-cadmium efflux system membrane fusion protein